MHESVLEFLKKNIIPKEIRHKRILEVGSGIVNGSPREIIQPMKPNAYIGLDTAWAPGVDIVGSAEDLRSKFESESFDVVISTEMMEHVVNWRKVISQLKLMVRPNGLLFVTTRSPGFPYHPYPIDVWRYTANHVRQIFSDMKTLVLANDPMVPGIFIKAQKVTPFIERDLSSIEVTPMVPP